MTAAASPEPDALAGAWPVFLRRLADQKISLAAYLAEAKPLALEGDTLTVGLPGFALHQEVLGVAENRRLITQLLSELLGSSITVQYATLPESGVPSAAPKAPAAAVPPVVQDIVNLFNATLLNQQPPRAA